jgi:hypothetical protein
MPPKKNTRRNRKTTSRGQSGSVVAPHSAVLVPYMQNSSAYTNPLTLGPRYEPFPNRTVRSMRYVYTTTLSGTGTANAFGTSVTFNLNSLFQPNSGGHQPYGFDTLATLYERYKVLATHVEISAMYTGSIQNCFVGLIMLPPGEAATIAGSTVEIVSEKPRAIALPVVGGTNAGMITVSQDFDMKTAAGLSAVEFKANVEDYAALVTASPSRLPRLEVAVADFATTTASSLKFRFDFIFKAEFFDRTILTQS